MNATSTLTALDQFLDPLADCLSQEVAQRIIGLRLDPAIQTRLDELADKASAGTLTEAEREQYQAYVEGMDIVGLFKAKARRSLARRTS